MKCVLLLVILVMALPWVSSVARAETVVIRNDGGGNIGLYRARRAALLQAGQVRIEGKCLSACAIFTTLPNACVMPKALIGFHGASPKTGKPKWDYYKDMRMGEYFRGEIRRRYEAKWRHLQGGEQFHVMDGLTLHRLDPKVKLCPGAKIRSG